MKDFTSGFLVTAILIIITFTCFYIGAWYQFKEIEYNCVTYNSAYFHSKKIVCTLEIEEEF